MNWELEMYMRGFSEAEEPDIRLLTFIVQKNIYFCFIPRQYITKQRYHLANKSPCNQNFSLWSSYVWMWVLVVESLSCVSLFSTHGLHHSRLSCSSVSPGVCPAYVHWLSDAIQPSHPLSPPSPPTLSLSKHQGLFQWVGSLHQVARVLKLQLQHQSFQRIFRVDFLWNWLVWLLTIQGTLKSFFQHHNLKTSIFQCWAFFMVQLLHP